MIEQLRKLPLRHLCERLRRANVKVICGPQRVRRTLSADREIVNDLVQDVAVAMLAAIHRGAINSARPAIYTWIQRVAARIAREKSRAAALSLLTGAHLSDDDGNDEFLSPDPPPLAGVNGCPLAGTEELEDVLDVRTQLKELMFSSIPANLTDGQELVFTRRLEGASHKEIAEELGISEGASRLRLKNAMDVMRTIKLAAA